MNPGANKILPHCRITVELFEIKFLFPEWTPNALAVINLLFQSYFLFSNLDALVKRTWQDTTGPFPEIATQAQWNS